MKPEELAGVLTEFAQTMVTDFPIQGILDHLVSRIVEVMPISAAGVTLIAPGLRPRYVAASDTSAMRFEKLQTTVGGGPCLAAYQTGRAISVPDLRRDHRFPTFAPRARTAGLAAMFSFPLRHGHMQLGALDLYRDTPGPLSRGSLIAAQTLADVAAAYLINAQARSDLQDSSDQSREAALHDPLTGLPNRVLMLELLEHAFRSSTRSGKTTAVFFVDLDRFKEVNDTYGHQVGDRLLVAVGERLTGVLRPGDSLARLAGDEFVVLCENLENPSQADPIAVRLHQGLSRPFALGGVTVGVTASIGIAFTGHGSQAADELLRDADFAMYRSKRNRAAKHDVLDLRDLHLAGYQASLARSLPGAIDRDELHLDYQPIVDADDRRLTGVEALLRWTHPTRGAISPTVFVPLAEQSGQIREIGLWVLNQACSDHHTWNRQRTDSISMSVNVSPHQFMSAGFAESVAGVLAQRSVDPGLINLEVTEGVLVRDEQRALVVIDELTDVGVKLALDDFGTGYSSLGYLNTLPIDTIKIDQTFIAKLTHDPDSQRIVTAIIQLAHSLEMTVIAEGVETAEQHRELTHLGSDSCQGFYFARPMTASSLDTLLHHRGGPTDVRLPPTQPPTTRPPGGAYGSPANAPQPPLLTDGRGCDSPATSQNGEHAARLDLPLQGTSTHGEQAHSDTPAR
jgi:diguanylate cyclase (GGDEF)-like protein